MKVILKFYLLIIACILMSCSGEEKKFKALLKDENISRVIYNVNIIDVEDGVILPNRTVFIIEDKIEAITSTYTLDSIYSAKIIDGSNMYLSPGLWDMHTHSQGEQILKEVQIPLFICHGITGIREMSGLPYEISIRDSIYNSLLDGPRMIVGSPVLDKYPNTSGTPYLLVTSVNDVENVIDSIIELDYDFIKTYDFLSHDVYKKIHELVSEKDIDVTGHIPIDVSIWDAISMEHRSIEHLIGVELGAAFNENELRIKYATRLKDSLNDEQKFQNVLKSIKYDSWSEAVDFIDENKLDSLYRFIKKNDVWIVPSLFLQKAITNPDIIADEPGLEFFPKKYRSPMVFRMFYDTDNKLEKVHNYRIEHFNKLVESGVKLLAGSDAFGGFPLHRELELYVARGLSPAEAIKTATINPAIYIGKQDALGSVEVGKFADLIILEGNPLEDIKNIRKINTVILNGKLFNKSDIDQMLKRVKYIANNM